MNPRDNPYEGLRNHALHVSRADIGLSPMPTPTTPWGAIMDWGVPNGTVTVVAFLNGDASIYLSSGGGFIGAKSSVAAKEMVDVGAKVQPLCHQAQSFVLPQTGQVTFYLLTDSGIFTIGASENELRTGHDSLAALGNAAQAVITEYRKRQASH